MADWGDLQSIFQLGAALNLGVAGIVGAIDQHLRRERAILASAHNSLETLKESIKIKGVSDSDLDNLILRADAKEEEFRKAIENSGSKSDERFRTLINIFLILSAICIVMLAIATANSGHVIWDGTAISTISAIILFNILLVGPVVLVAALSQNIRSWFTSTVERERVLFVGLVDDCFVRLNTLT